MDKSAVIIGAGLGGLQCGFILAKEGYRVTVLERGRQIGGCLQAFQRDGREFDTGFHYVGGLGSGEPLNKIFRYFGLMELPWHKLDTEAFDEVIIKDKNYFFSNSGFANKMAEYFPERREEIEEYGAFLKKIGEDIFEGEAMQYFEKSAHHYLDGLFKGDAGVIDVLSGTSLKMELCRETLPLYTFAQINSSFIQSAWRLRGSGSQITDALAASILKMGGTILKGCNVTAINETDGKATGVSYTTRRGESASVESLNADIIVSDVHPAQTLGMLDESGSIRKVYRKRVVALPQTSGMFTVNLLLKKGVVPYLNRNIYIYNQKVWDADDGIMVSYRVPEDDSGYASSIDIITPMPWAEVAKWEKTSVGERGEEYDRMKEEKARKCILKASSYIPQLRNGILSFTASTPLTWRDYTGTPEGSAYGIKKDWNNTLCTILPPRTPISNLFFTGQNLNLHGVLGVSMTSLITCSEILKRQFPLLNM